MTIREPHQGSLFEGLDPAAPSAALVAIDKGVAPLGKAQRTFNRLIGQIRRLREELATWAEYEGRYQQRVAGELAPAEEAAREAQRRLLRRLDELMELRASGERLSRKERRRVAGQIRLLLDDLPAADGDDPELDTLHKKYTGVSREERDRAELEMAGAFLGEIFGADAVEGHEAASVDELMRFAGDRIAERAAAEQAERDRRRSATATRRRKRSPRAELAAERKAQAKEEALRSVREVYRRLASALHPDREADPGERGRKTLLMQRVNQAYAKSDLLELLSLQIEIEQIDPERLAETPEERLGHFNAVLREQQRALETELAERLIPFRMAMSAPAGALTPHKVDRALSMQIGEAQAMHRTIEADLERLADASERRALIDALPDSEADDVFGADALDDLVIDMLAGAAPQRPVRRAKAGKRRKKRRHR